MAWTKSLNKMMEEDVEDIESLDPSPTLEEPWCATCHAFTDYRRKWDTIQRADLDGGSYSENFEIPHCINCDKPMLLLSTCRKLVWSVNSLTIFAWLIGLLGVLVLFGFSLGSIVGLFIHGGFCYLTSRLPLKSRLTLQSYKKAKKEESLKKLLQKI
jgi:hypothetical protein